jgi:hypothetical protein
LVICACIALVLGCDSGEQIQRYQVSKAKPADDAVGHISAPAGPSAQRPAGSMAHPGGSADRMLGAIIIRGDRAWFFKAAGVDKTLGEQAAAFRAMIESIRFADDQPTWKLPDGWRQKPGSGMRFATLEFGPTEAPTELTVIPLGVPPGDRTAYLLSNVNRWRQQVGLEPIDAAQLASDAAEVKLDGDMVATVVDLKGGSASTGMGPVPVGAAGSGPAKPGAASESQAAAGQPSSFRSSPPSGWTPGQKSITRGGVTISHEAAFEVADGDKKAEITVDHLPPAGDFASNVNRWRQQIGLSPWSEAELKAATKQVEVGGVTGDYVELVGEQQSTLGVIANRGNETWYIKLKGDKGLVAREKEGFDAFLKSVSFQ